MANAKTPGKHDAPTQGPPEVLSDSWREHSEPHPNPYYPPPQFVSEVPHATQTRDVKGNP